MPTITLGQLPGEFRLTAWLIEGAGVRALRRAAQRSRVEVQKVIDETQPYPPVDTGHYRRAWTVENVPDGADLLNPVMYAPVIEYGSRPHFVPFDALLQWARRKLRGGALRGQTKDRAAKSLAARAQKAIRKRGTTPRDVLGRTEPKMWQAVRHALDHELARAVRRGGGGGGGGHH